MKDKRIKILQLLEGHGIVSAQAIATKLNVSERMVRSYIKQINDKNPCIGSSKQGYYLNAQPNANTTELYGQMARVFYILTAISDNQYIYIASLADELNVSDATIELDLKNMKDIMCEFSLQIKREKHAVCLVGDEFEKRKLYKKILIQNEGIYSFSTGCYEQLFTITNLNQIKAIIQRGLREYHQTMNEFSLLNLAVHIGISIERIVIHNQGKVFPGVIQVDQMLQKLSSSIIMHLCDQYQVVIAGMDYQDIEFAIISRIMPEQIHMEKVNDSLVKSNTIYFVKNLMNKITMLFHLDFYNEVFSIQFAIHVEKLVHRASLHAYQYNPLCDTIRSEYPVLFDIAVFIGDEIQHDYHIQLDESELAFIVLHLGNAVNIMMNTKEMGYMKLLLYYPAYYDLAKKEADYLSAQLHHDFEIKIVSELTKEVLREADAVLSVHPVKEELMIPKVMIRPLPHKDDIEILQSFLDEIQQCKIKKNLTQFITNFEYKIYEEDIYCEDERRTIEYLCNELLSRNLICEAFQSAVLERELTSSTYIGNGIALPHSSGIRAQQNFVYILYNHKPMRWGNEKARIILLFGMTSKSEFITTFHYFVNYKEHIANHITSILKNIPH